MKALINPLTKNKRYKGQQHKYIFRIILFLFIYPYLVGFSPDSTSSSGTIVDLLLGMGKHSAVSYDCAGNPTSITNFATADYGISASHYIEAFKFGGRAGGYSVKKLEQKYPSNNSFSYDAYNPVASNNTSVLYLNPFIGAENKYVEMNVGVSFFSKPAIKMFEDDRAKGNIGTYLIGEGNVHPTWLLRIGNKEKFHFSTQYLSNVPVFSGGGIADFGFGFGSTESRNLTWIGLSWGPCQNAGLSIKQSIQVSEKVDILLRGRAGSIEDNFEGGISGGLRINL